MVAVPLILLSGLAGLAALPGKSSGSGDRRTEDAIADDTHFYGQSPPVYPSREFIRAMRRLGGVLISDSGYDGAWGLGGSV